MTYAALDAWWALYSRSTLNPQIPAYKQKEFKPKCPELTRQLTYRNLPDSFWNRFPANFNFPAKPNISWTALVALAENLGTSNQARLDRVVHRLQYGANIGCEGAARLPSASHNSKDAYLNGRQVTDGLRLWTSQERRPSGKYKN